MRAGKGPRCEWEDVFCSVLGVNWRHLLDQCQSAQQWHEHWHEFACRVCNNWGLPALASDKSPDQSSLSIDKPTFKHPRRVAHLLVEAPHEHGENCPRLSWQAHSMTFACIVDCKPLADILGGHAPLKVPSLGPIFERITTRFFSLMDMGWGTSELTNDPIIWHRRSTTSWRTFWSTIRWT